MLLQEKPTFTVVNIKDSFLFTRRLVNIGNMQVELLDQQVVYKHGSYRKMKLWLKGAYPGLGVIVRGYTGVETVVCIDVIVPIKTFFVSD